MFFMRLQGSDIIIIMPGNSNSGPKGGRRCCRAGPDFSGSRGFRTIFPIVHVRHRCRSGGDAFPGVQVRDWDPAGEV